MKTHTCECARARRHIHACTHARTHARTNTHTHTHTHTITSTLRGQLGVKQVNQPSKQASKQPTNQPTSQPTSQPTNQPTNQQANQPANSPSLAPLTRTWIIISISIRCRQQHNKTRRSDSRSAVGLFMSSTIEHHLKSTGCLRPLCRVLYLRSYPAQTHSVAHFSLAYLRSSTSCRRQRDVIETTVLARMRAQFKEFMVSLMACVKGSCCSVFFPLVVCLVLLHFLRVIAGAIV